jgi:hypothetical protein
MDTKEQDLRVVLVHIRRELGGFCELQGELLSAPGRASHGVRCLSIALHRKEKVGSPGSVASRDSDCQFADPNSKADLRVEPAQIREFLGEPPLTDRR